MRRLTLIFALILSTPSLVAHAQSNPRQLAEANRNAMDAYNNLDVEVAKSTLERAIAGAESNGLSGSGLARTYANLGVVEVGGFSDSAAALDAFVRALQEDATVEPDPLVSTPEVLQIFAQAKRKGGQGGGKRPKPSAPAAAPAVVEGNLEHVPAVEQLKNTNLPVFVSASNPEVVSMKIFYRSVGMPKPKSASMRRTSDGFSHEIVCGDVFEPSVEYFVLGYDEAGEKIGNAGTPENPVSVPIVSVRSEPAPSLPGAIPPTQCGGGETAAYAAAASAPSISNMGREGVMGDTCSVDNDCGEGLVCHDNFCALGNRKNKKSSDGERPGIYFDLGIGIAAVMVTPNSATDSNPPLPVMTEAEGRARSAYPSVPADQLLAAQVYTGGYGWNCDVNRNEMDAFTFGDCKTNVGGSGFVMVPVLNAALGYRLTPRLGLAVTGRYQFDHGEKSKGLGGGLRADILLTEPSETGFHAGLIAGLQFGRVQAKAPAVAASQDPGMMVQGVKGPYATSGGFGLQGGLRLGYQISRNFGLGATVLANMMMGPFLFNLDITVGPQLAF